MEKTQKTALIQLVVDHVNEIIDSTVEATGNGAMARVSKKYLGKQVKILILDAQGRNR